MTSWFIMIIFRFLFVFILYLFLFHVLRLMYQDLFREARINYPLKSGNLVLRVKESLNANLKKGQVYPLAESIMIGREEWNDIVIKESHVSGRHAIITRQGPRWQIRDLGSTNGTYVNGIRIEGPVDLVPGMKIRIGGVTFEVGWENASRSAYSYRLNTTR